jgi:hypothetical protein
MSEAVRADGTRPRAADAPRWAGGTSLPPAQSGTGL